MADCSDALRTIDEDLLQCYVCYGELKSPKTLQCLHSFCQECLQMQVSLAETLRTGDCVLRCPTCRDDTLLKHKDVSVLPNDFRLTKLRLILDEHKRDLAKNEEAEREKAPVRGTADENVKESSWFELHEECLFPQGISQGGAESARTSAIEAELLQLQKEQISAKLKYEQSIVATRVQISEGIQRMLTEKERLLRKVEKEFLQQHQGILRRVERLKYEISAFSAQQKKPAGKPCETSSKTRVSRRLSAQDKPATSR